MIVPRLPVCTGRHRRFEKEVLDETRAAIGVVVNVEHFGALILLQVTRDVRLNADGKAYGGLRSFTYEDLSDDGSLSCNDGKPDHGEFVRLGAKK